MEVSRVLNNNPPWLCFISTFVRDSLNALKHAELQGVACSAGRKHGVRDVQNNKTGFVDIILFDFESECLTVGVSANEAICARNREYGFYAPNSLPQCVLISHLFGLSYGSVVVSALRKMPWL
jgi:hypothetical protein